MFSLFKDLSNFKLTPIYLQPTMHTKGFHTHRQVGKYSIQKMLETVVNSTAFPLQKNTVICLPGVLPRCYSNAEE